MTDEQKITEIMSAVCGFEELSRIAVSRRSKECRKGRLLLRLREYENKHKEKVTVSEIARFTGLAVPNVSRLLKPFETDGLIERIKQGRNVCIAITDKGNALFENQNAEFKAACAKAAELLSDDEFRTFMICTKKIHAIFADYLKTDAGE